MEEPTHRWKVEYSNKAGKQKKTLPEKIQALADLLAKEIEVAGPLRTNWPNYGPLHKDRRKGIPDNAYHCHLKKGKPTFVACWYVVDKKIKFVEIYYVGTHEKAPY